MASPRTIIVFLHTRGHERMRLSGLTWEVTWCWSKWERCWNLEKISSAVGKASGLLLFFFCPSSPPFYEGNGGRTEMREGTAIYNWSAVFLQVYRTDHP